MPLLKLNKIFHDIVLSILSVTKSQFYLSNLNVSAREQFCQKLDFFDLQTANKLQPIDSAACRKLRFKLAEMNLIDFCILKEKKYTLLDFKAVVLPLIF